MKKIKPYNLRYWYKLSDHSDMGEFASVTLYMEGYYDMTCSVKPNGNIKISTHSGGGHGEGTFDHKGTSYDEWTGLIGEAESVRRHYFE